MFSLEGKNALVIGAGGILGPVFSEAIVAAGASIIMADLVRPEAAARAIAERHPEAQVSTLGLDLRDPIAVREAIAALDRQNGPLDVVHVNAATKGSDLDAFFAEDDSFDPAVWREIMSVNLDGLYFAASAAGKMMSVRGRGSIILTSSIYGLMAPDQRVYEGSQYLGRQIRSPAVYSASKAGVGGVVRHLAALWGHVNVRVNGIAPGGVSSGQNGIFQQRYSQRVPLGRMARAEEMAGALVFLASDAASYVTGQVIAVDGGLSVW